MLELLHKSSRRDESQSQKKMRQICLQAELCEENPYIKADSESQLKCQLTTQCQLSLLTSLAKLKWCKLPRVIITLPLIVLLVKKKKNRFSILAFKRQT